MDISYRMNANNSVYLVWNTCFGLVRFIGTFRTVMNPIHCLLKSQSLLLTKSWYIHLKQLNEMFTLCCSAVWWVHVWIRRCHIEKKDISPITKYKSQIDFVFLFVVVTVIEASFLISRFIIIILRIFCVFQSHWFRIDTLQATVWYEAKPP